MSALNNTEKDFETAVIIIWLPQRMSSQHGFNKTYCEDFQSELTYERIDNIWKSFREAGNSIESRVAKPVPPPTVRTSKKCSISSASKTTSSSIDCSSALNLINPTTRATRKRLISRILLSVLPYYREYPSSRRSNV